MYLVHTLNFGNEDIRKFGQVDSVEMTMFSGELESSSEITGPLTCVSISMQLSSYLRVSHMTAPAA